MKAPILKQKRHFYSFGPFRLYRAERELFLGDQAVDLPPKALEALLLLLSRRGHVVGKDEFMTALWPDTFVEESSLTRQVSDLRKALARGADDERFIETIPRRGYRFTADVTESWEEGQAEPELEVVGAPQEDDETSARRQRVAALAAVLAAAAALLAAGIFLGWRLSEPPPGHGPLRQFGFTPPVGIAAYTWDQRVNLAVSPDGKHIVFAGLTDDRLWVYDLERGESRALDDTAGAEDPFWSPDSESIAYFSGAQIRQIPARGGPPVRLYQRPGSPNDRGPDSRLRGGTFSPDGASIVFSEDGSLYEMPAGGGVPELLVAPAESPPEHGSSAGPWGLIRWPHFAPAEVGARVLFYTCGTWNDRTMMAHDLELGRQAILGAGEMPFYAPSGHVLYQAGPWDYDLWALPFSMETLEETGSAFPIARDARLPMAASDGTLVYLDLDPAGGQWRLAWIDRQGNKVGEIGEPHESLDSPALSPDGRLVAVTADDDIWVWDIERGTRTRLTSAPGRDERPVWSPGGDEVAFTSARAGSRDILVRKADGSGDVNVLAATPGVEERLSDWSRDGKRLLYHMDDSGYDVWYLERRADGGGWEPHPFLQTPFSEFVPRISPDGRYVAFLSNESGRSEVYVQPFPEGDGPRVTVSSNGGNQVRWSRDGKELFYVEEQTLIAVSVSTGSSFSVDSMTPLFEHPSLGVSRTNYPPYDVSLDGQRFILPERVGGDKAPARPSIRVVQNWYEEFRDRGEQR